MGKGLIDARPAIARAGRDGEAAQNNEGDQERDEHHESDRVHGGLGDLITSSGGFSLPAILKAVPITIPAAPHSM